MQIPWRCATCDTENMIDVTRLENQAAGKLYQARGFACSQCGAWCPVFYSTRSLESALAKLEEKDTSRKDYAFHFAKTLKKAEGVQKSFLMKSDP